jgi:hypothetical protein
MPFIHAKATHDVWLDICNTAPNVPIFMDFWKEVFDIHVSKLAKYNDTEYEVLDIIKTKFKPFVDPIRSAVTNSTIWTTNHRLQTRRSSGAALHKVMKAFIQTLDVSKDEKGKGVSRDPCKIPLDKIRAVCIAEFKDGYYDKCDDFVVSVNNQITKIQEANKKLREQRSTFYQVRQLKAQLWWQQQYHQRGDRRHS